MAARNNTLEISVFQIIMGVGRWEGRKLRQQCRGDCLSSCSVRRQTAKTPSVAKKSFSQRQNGSHSYTKNKRIKMPRTGPQVATKLSAGRKASIYSSVTDQATATSKAFTRRCQGDRESHFKDIYYSRHTNYRKGFPGLELMTASLGGFPLSRI